MKCKTIYLITSVLSLIALSTSLPVLAESIQSDSLPPAAPAISVTLISPTLTEQYFVQVKGPALTALMSGDHQKALDLSQSFQATIPVGRTIAREVHPERRATIAALAAQQLGEHQVAIDILKAAIDLRAADPDLHYLNGLSLAALGQLEIAQDEIQQAIWFSRKSSVGQTLITPGLALTALGTLQSARGLTTQAQRNLATAIALEPELFAARLAIAGSQLDSGDPANAIVNARAAVAHDSQSPQAQLLLARALLGTANRRVDALFTTSATESASAGCRSELIEARDITRAMTNMEGIAPELKNQASAISVRAMLGCRDLEGAKAELKSFEARAPGNPDLVALQQQLALENSEQPDTTHSVR